MHGLPAPPSPLAALLPRPPERAGEPKPYYAATRAGMKRITVTVSPGEHNRLKRLAVDIDRSIADLVREALADLFAKHQPQASRAAASDYDRD
jgi:hypothetical protein